MSGFFTDDQVKSKTRPDGIVYSCAGCALYRGPINPKMKPTGNFEKQILILGEYPNSAEDKTGKHWKGPNGKLLKNTLEKFGVDLFEDCLSINAINCYPGEKKSGTFNIASCRLVVNPIIEQYQPRLIILLGMDAVHSIIGAKWKRDIGDIHQWRGFAIPDQDFDCWVCPTLHPNYIDPKKRELKTIWEQDLKEAISLIDKSIPKLSKPVIHYLEDLSPLNQITADVIAFDYETTGIKPHAKGHRIICASVATSEKEVYTFMMPKSKKDRMPFINLLTNNLISKMAHNMKYEDIWTNVRLKTKIRNWSWDSMIAAHLIDNRTGITSLKFQAFVNFGVADYDSEIRNFLRSGSKDANALNKIHKLIETEEGRHKLLTYCALDSIYEYRLAMKQIELIDYDFLPF